MTTNAEKEPTFHWPEERLHESLGVSRRVLREKRALCAKGEDWQLIQNEVRWSDVGLKKVSDLLEVEKPEAPPAGPQPETLTVASSPAFPDGRHLANRCTIRARRADGEIVTVRVPDPSKFVPHQKDGTPMTLPAERSQWGWTLVGKSPRWRGCW